MLKDNLNAEVVLGTVTNLREACAWLGYTYLHMRMQANPLAYGMTWKEVSGGRARTHMAGMCEARPAGLNEGMWVATQRGTSCMA